MQPSFPPRKDKAVKPPSRANTMPETNNNTRRRAAPPPPTTVQQPNDMPPNYLPMSADSLPNVLARNQNLLQGALNMVPVQQPEDETESDEEPSPPNNLSQNYSTSSSRTQVVYIQEQLPGNTYGDLTAEGDARIIRGDVLPTHPTGPWFGRRNTYGATTVKGRAQMVDGNVTTTLAETFLGIQRPAPGSGPRRQHRRPRDQ